MLQARRVFGLLYNISLLTVTSKEIMEHCSRLKEKSLQHGDDKDPDVKRASLNESLKCMCKKRWKLEF